MVSLKANALAEWTAARGLGLTRFDYSGHGQSSGQFEDGTIGTWLEDAATVFQEVTSGPQILVGSSMGGWLALLLLRQALEAKAARAEQTAKAGQTALRGAGASPQYAATRIKGLVLIAPAWDMTEELMWKSATPKIIEEMERTGRYLRPSDYDDDPYIITRQLIEEGRNHLIKRAPFNPGLPISILHGKLDPDVPFDHSLALKALLPGNHIAITAVPDGEHRLSRPQDLDLLCRLIEDMMEKLGAGAVGT